MTSLDHLNRLNGIEELRRPNHPNDVRKQSPKLPLHVSEDEGG